MRILCRLMMVGILFFCSNDLLSLNMEEALAELDNGGGPQPDPNPDPSDNPPVPPAAPTPPAPGAPTPPAPGAPTPPAPGAPTPPAPPAGPAPKVGSAIQEVQAQATLSITDVHTSGLDTINIDSGGNWLEKRKWFMHAEKLFGEIRLSVEKAENLRVNFVDAVNAVGKKIDSFYDQVGFEKGQLDELLKNNLHEISGEEFKRGHDLSDKERSSKIALQAAQKEIEQIGGDIEKVAEFDTQIDKTMQQAFKTIDECRALESKAWADFKSIGTELDDKKARTLYYEMENAQKNIEQHTQYLKATLLPYLQTKLVATTTQVINTITTSVKALDAKGVHLDALIKGYEQQDLVVEQERTEATEKSVEGAWEKTEEQKEEAKQKEEQEKATQKKAKKLEEEQSTWYMKFIHSMAAKLQTLGCFIFNGIRIVSCKIFELAPGFFETISNAAITVWGYIIGFFSALPCYFKCIVCSIRSWICQLLGK